MVEAHSRMNAPRGGGATVEGRTAFLEKERTRLARCLIKIVSGAIGGSW